MIIDNMKPLYDGKRTCLQDLIATVASHWEKPVDLMFSQSWGLAFNAVKNGEVYTVGNRLLSQFDTSFDELSRYHGIDLQIAQMDHAENMLSHIEESLNKNLPVIIYLDNYWTPWMYGYQVNYREHYMLVTGINNNEQVLYCMDPINKKIGEKLPFADFIKGNEGRGAFFRFHTDIEEINLDEWRSRLHSKLWPQNGPSVFDCIHSLADAIADPRFDMKQEVALAGGQSIWGSPLIWNLIHADRGRYCFRLAPLYIAEHCNIRRFKELAEQMTESADEWVAIRNMLLKLFYLNETPVAFKDSITDKIHKIAEMERKVGEGFISGGTEPQLWSICSEPSSMIANWTPEDIPLNLRTTTTGMEQLFNLSVDLDEWVNNSGFGARFSGASLTCMDGNEHFLLEVGGDSPPWQVEECSAFDFKEPLPGKGDNVACLGQSISVMPGYYSRLDLIGCAEWGNYKETLTIVYEDGSRREKELAFSDWAADIPSFRERVLWSGTTVLYYDNVAYVQDKKKSLYIQSIPITMDKRIVALELPLCPNLHIFAGNLYYQSPEAGMENAN